MKTLIFIVPALISTAAGFFFLLNVPLSISDALKLDLIIAFTFIVLSSGLITVLVKVLRSES